MKQVIPLWTPKTTPIEASTTPPSMVGAIVVDYTMPIINTKIINKYILDILTEGGVGVNILTNTLRKHLGLPKPKSCHLQHQDG